jgi:hypothetical protein
MGAVIALNPVSRAPGLVGDHGPGLSDLAGKAVGFLSNNKPNAGVVLGRVAACLAERFGVAARYYNKGVPSLCASEDLIEEIARDCQAVVLAISD